MRPTARARELAAEAVAALPRAAAAGAGDRRNPSRAPAKLGAVSWVFTILGIVALIILHELGHFTVAKLVGMRVERFSLFFPPTLFKVRRGETEYAIGAIPAGGYVKITGMNPEELKRSSSPRWQRAAPTTTSRRGSGSR